MQRRQTRVGQAYCFTGGANAGGKPAVIAALPAGGGKRGPGGRRFLYDTMPRLDKSGFSRDLIPGGMAAGRVRSGRRSGKSPRSRPPPTIGKNLGPQGTDSPWKVVFAHFMKSGSVRGRGPCSAVLIWHAIIGLSWRRRGRPPKTCSVVRSAVKEWADTTDKALGLVPPAFANLDRGFGRNSPADLVFFFRRALPEGGHIPPGRIKAFSFFFPFPICRPDFRRLLFVCCTSRDGRPGTIPTIAATARTSGQTRRRLVLGLTGAKPATLIALVRAAG